jgi:hypothetical protein
MKLPIKSMTIAGALFKAISFLLVSLFNLVWPPYGGAFLGMQSSLYPYYDPAAVPLGIFIGTLYAAIAGAVAGALFGWLYNSFAGR